MSGPAARDPWADPATPTEEGPPYAGPPAYPPSGYAVPGHAMPGYGAPGYAVPGYPPPGYAPAGHALPGHPPAGYGWPYAPGQPYGPWGYPAPWPAAPAGPRRPGQVVAAAVLALVQAALVALTTAYVFLVASVLAFGSAEFGDPRTEAFAQEANVLAVVQVLSVVALVVGGVMALTRRGRGTWITLLVALGFQLVLALYWGVRVVAVLADIPGPDSAAGVFVVGAICFAAAPAVGTGLLVVPAARRWFGIAQAGAPAAPPTAGTPAGTP